MNTTRISNEEFEIFLANATEELNHKAALLRKQHGLGFHAAQTESDQLESWESSIRRLRASIDGPRPNPWGGHMFTGQCYERYEIRDC